MARAQMLCIVTPDAPSDVPPSLTRRLDAALRRAGCVHFATLALLPPLPAAPALTPPSLMFEVVVDDGLDLAGAVDVLIAAGFAVLWRLYRSAWPGPARAGLEARRRWLRDFLLAHADRAACGFIGARDRTVRQILAEARRLADARLQLQVLRYQRPDSQARARSLIEWDERQNPDAPREPARRSIWRRGGLPGWLRWPLLGLRLVVPVLALVTLLAGLGFAIASIPQLLRAVGLEGATSEFAVPALATAVIVLVSVAVLLAARYAEALVAMLLFTVLAAVAVLAALLMMLWSRDWSVFWCAMQLVVVGLGAWLSMLLGLVVVLALLALPWLRAPPFLPLLATLVTAVVGGVLTYLGSVLTVGQLRSLQCPYTQWQPQQHLPWAGAWFWIGIGAILLAAVVAGVPHLVGRLQRTAERLLDQRALPPLPELPPLHQVHPSIDACEAGLIGRQSHMISLTEIRAPTWWHGGWLRLKLWLINQLADVYFTDGRLGGADGIKFGHWRLLDRGRRLLFVSNYDGSFGGYLDEFIRGAWQGVNLVWGGTELRPRAPARADQPGVAARRPFPPVRSFILYGCKYEQAFKAYARTSMLPHLYRFEAYNLSLQDIERATRLRDALCLPRTPTKNDEILRAIES